jgi:hypothetical protein
MIALSEQEIIVGQKNRRQSELLQWAAATLFLASSVGGALTGGVAPDLGAIRI